jgi:glycerol uptake facilitator-like aquaporin
MTPARLPLARALDEFELTTVLLFLAVTVVRWLRHPASPLFIPNLYVALAVVGFVSGAILTALIFTPPGRRSGGHMNPAVTITVWLVGVFPGRSVLPYVVAQLAGSVAGTALAPPRLGIRGHPSPGRLRRDQTRPELGPVVGVRR